MMDKTELGDKHTHNSCSQSHSWWQGNVSLLPTLLLEVCKIKESQILTTMGKGSSSRTHPSST